MKVVFSIGGSILAPEGVDQEYVAKLSKLLRSLSKKHGIAVVVGGGRPARKNIEKARNEGKTMAYCDYVGILATRENAKALISALGGGSNDIVPESIHDAANLFGEKILVMGGTEPGHSTDAVAAVLSDWVGADVFVNASNVDAVYDKNPKKFSDAKPIGKININDLFTILKDEGVCAGEYPLLDHVALSIIRRSKIKTLFVDGRDIKNMADAVEGRRFKGTTVVY
ncbi:MAG: UMP kinase [Candidatus Altiarchaeota archaeon]|nr:UMP kinase [Candidatus Altiarchaeota archaeon]